MSHDTQGPRLALARFLPPPPRPAHVGNVSGPAAPPSELLAPASCQGRAWRTACGRSPGRVRGGGPGQRHCAWHMVGAPQTPPGFAPAPAPHLACAQNPLARSSTSHTGEKDEMTAQGESLPSFKKPGPLCRDLVLSVNHRYLLNLPTNGYLHRPFCSQASRARCLREPACRGSHACSLLNLGNTARFEENAGG